MRVCVEACRCLRKHPLPDQLNPGTALIVAEFEGMIRTGDKFHPGLCLYQIWLFHPCTNTVDSQKNLSTVLSRI